MPDNELKVVIGADNKPLQSTLAQSEQDVRSFGSLLSGIGAGIGIGIGEQLLDEAGQAVHRLVEGSIEEFERMQATSTNLRLSLEAVGRGDVFADLAHSSEELHTQFKYLGEPDIQAAFQKIVQLGGLTENQIKQLLPVVIDLNAKQRLSGETNKALAETAQDVVRGLEGQGRALRQYGVGVSQKNTEVENLGIIMDTLGQKAKGAGEAFANSFEGQIAASTERVKELQIQLGEKLLPLKVHVLNFANEVADGFGALWTRLTDGPAHEALQNIRLMTEFSQNKATEKFELIKDEDVSDLTSELIKLTANVEKTRAALKHHTEDDDFRKQWILEIGVNEQLIAKIKEQIKVKSDLRTIGTPGLDKEEKEKGPTLVQSLYKAGEALDKQWGEIIKEADKNYDKYFTDMEKRLTDQARIKKVIDALNHVNEAVQLGLANISAPERGVGDTALPLNGDAVGADQLAKITKAYRDIGAKPPDVSWLQDAGAKALLLNLNFEKVSKTFNQLKNFTSDFLQPAFSNLFSSIISGSQSIGQALQSFLKNLITQLLTTLATAAALAGIFALFGFGGGASFGKLFSGFLGGSSSGLGGLFGGSAGGGLGFSGSGLDFVGFGAQSLSTKVSGQDLLIILDRANTSNGRRGG